MMPMTEGAYLLQCNTTLYK